MSEVIHIVCLDAPAPPDYGGAIDMYYKIKALSRLGKKIILHYFDYRDRDVSELQPFCQEVHAYTRRITPRILLPYIVSSRINRSLIARLNADRHPILLEGIHCSGIVPFLQAAHRIVLRLHNDEEAYYSGLAKWEKNYRRWLYLQLESRLLNRYQANLQRNLPVACLSKKDESVFKQKGFSQLSFIPCFIPWQEVSINSGISNFCLYHGNLAVPENEAAALWLIRNVFRRLDILLIIAGNGASDALVQEVRSTKRARIINNPSIAELDLLVKEAQINLVPSLNNTGVKLKLLHVLLEGRHCISNKAGVEGSSIQEGIHMAETPEECIRLVTYLMEQPVTEVDLGKRNKILELYNNEANAKKLSALWSHYQ